MTAGTDEPVPELALDVDGLAGSAKSRQPATAGASPTPALRRPGVVVEDLVDRVIAGDETAWRALWLETEPTVWAITGKWRVTGPLSQSEDDRRNIVDEVMAHLRADGYSALRAFQVSRAR